MGHLTLISEDVLTTLEHSSPDLRLTTMKFAPEPGWHDYVNDRYLEIKNKDTGLLGEGRPALSLVGPGSAAPWKVDEQDIVTTTTGAPIKRSSERVWPRGGRPAPIMIPERAMRGDRVRTVARLGLPGLVLGSFFPSGHRQPLRPRASIVGVQIH